MVILPRAKLQTIKHFVVHHRLKFTHDPPLLLLVMAESQGDEAQVIISTLIL